MSPTSFEPIAAAVLRLAKRQGYVLARDVRAELRIAGLPEKHWKEVIALAGPALLFRQGRFYTKESFNPRLKKEHAQQQAIRKLIRRIIKQNRSRAQDDDRRGQARIDFIHPVKVRTEDGREHAMLCRDVSSTGIRLLGTKRLLGQKVQIELPDPDTRPPCRLLTRILWTCAVADDLFENGGNFLEILDAD